MTEPPKKDLSMRSRVVRDYFRTTSAAAVDDQSRAERTASIDGLERRLSSWGAMAGLDVVDVGCGTGELCELAQRKGARSVVGVNLSLEEIDYARRQCAAQFVHSDVNEYLAAVPAASKDLVYALNFVEHLEDEPMSTFLEQVCRVLRPGGALIAMVPNATSPFGGMTRYWDITHVRAFTPASVRQLARLTGFSASSFRECGPVPHGPVSAARYGMWRVVRRAIWGYFMIELASDKGGIYTADMLFRLTK